MRISDSQHGYDRFGQTIARSIRPGIESIETGLRTLARLGAWPVLFICGNWLADVPVDHFLLNATLGVTLVLVVLTQIIFRVRLTFQGSDLLPPLIDITTLFVTASLTGGLSSPIRMAYFAFIIVDTIGLRVRFAAAVAIAYCASYALLGVAGPGGIPILNSRTHDVSVHALFLLWTAVTSSLLAGVLRNATRRAKSTALENAILYERAMRTGETLRSILNSTETGIFMISKDKRIWFMSRQAGDLLGVKPTDIMGMSMPQVLRQRLKHRFENPDQFEQRLLELYEDMEQEAVDDVKVVIPESRELSRYSAPVRDNNGELIGRIEIYSDVTEARASERLKDEFLSLAAHELKTPITSLKAYSQLLRRKPREEISDRLWTNALTTIDRQATQLALLVNDLLDVSRSETGRLQLHKERFDLGGLVAKLAAQTALADPDHEYSAQCNENLIIYADPSRIEQVVVNLLANAQKYSKAGTSISLETRKDGNFAIATVRDMGIGIPEDKMSRIFERFYQAHSTAEYSYGGMGIGLYISKDIIERHGGELWVESQEGQGSRFGFTLPLDLTADSGCIEDATG